MQAAYTSQSQQTRGTPVVLSACSAGSLNCQRLPCVPSTQDTPDWLPGMGKHAPKPTPHHCRLSLVPHPEASRRPPKKMPSLINFTCSCVLLYLHPVMVPHHLHSSMQTQKLQHILLVTLCISQKGLWDIMYAHLDMVQQLVIMGCSFPLPTVSSTALFTPCTHQAF